MPPNVITLLKFLILRIPLIINTALLNTLSLSANSSKQDLRTAIAVTILRVYLRQPTTIGQLQRFGLKGTAIKGRVWISKTTFTKPGDSTGVREAVVKAIQVLGDGEEKYSLPELNDVEGEWSGYRAGVERDAPQLDISEKEKYQLLMSDVKSNVTILYFHGGAYIAMDPATHRPTTVRLAHLTQGRCFSVRYRLAPQSTFPAQLLDCLVAYLSLLSPPPGAFHEPVPPSNIIIAGDSAGGNFALSLLLAILALRREGITKISFHGREVPLELPAGVMGMSPNCDITRALPSTLKNQSFDYIDPPEGVELVKICNADEFWPAHPPRVHHLVNASMLLHPLASPINAGPELWRGSPPIYLSIGNEGMEDEVTTVARRIYHGDGTVVFDGYEGMPHCFPMLFPHSVTGNQCFESIAKFCTAAVENRVEKRKTGTWMKAFSNPPQFREVDLADITSLADEDIYRVLRDVKERIIERELELQQEWQNQISKPKL